MSTYEVINTNNNKCITDFNITTKKLNSLPFNPFQIENFSEKQLLDMANTYITTDESLDKFQRQITENNNVNLKQFSNRMNKIKKMNKIESNSYQETHGNGHKIINKLIKLDNNF